MTIFDFLTAVVVVSVVMYGLYKIVGLGIVFRKDKFEERLNMYSSIYKVLNNIDGRLLHIVQTQNKQSED